MIVLTFLFILIEEMVCKNLRTLLMSISARGLVGGAWAIRTSVGMTAFSITSSLPGTSFA